MPNQTPKASLLTPAQKALLAEIAASNIVLISQRAQVLLLLNDGKSHAQASAETGLTIGQVRYALTRFRKAGQAMFPNLPQTASTAATVEQQPTRASKPSVAKKKKNKDRKKKAKNQKKGSKKKTQSEKAKQKVKKKAKKKARKKKSSAKKK